jgi:hypothetical protein
MKLFILSVVLFSVKCAEELSKEELQQKRELKREKLKEKYKSEGALDDEAIRMLEQERLQKREMRKRKLLEKEKKESSLARMQGSFINDVPDDITGTIFMALRNCENKKFNCLKF